MFDIFLEIAIAFVALTITFVFMRGLKHPTIGKHPGVFHVLIGFGLLLFSAMIDITDNFSALNSFIVIGDTKVQAFLEKVVGMLLGLVFLLRGFSLWLPSIQELEKTRQSLHLLTKELDRRVKQRSLELEHSNNSLKQEISERRKMEKKLKYQARYDDLTTIPNRTALIEALKGEIVQPCKPECYSAILFLDLNDFKQINDLFGHGTGDAVLKIVAQRLSTLCQSSDRFVGRLGGDEFVLLFNQLGEDSGCAKKRIADVVEQIMSIFNQPITLAGQKLIVSSSVGIKLFSNHDQETVYSLLRQADIALYHAKDNNSSGKGYSFFNDAMLASVTQRAELASELHQALDHDQFYLHYQPQVSSCGEVVGLEALLRWNHPSKQVDPQQFIPIAEEAGVIDKLGRFVLHRALREVSVMLANEVRSTKLKVAVNISPNHFFQSDFVEQISDIMSLYDLTNCYLVLEITENVVIQNIEDISTKMRQLLQLGVGISLDDFGTGYSSLSYLKSLPFDTLKIDRSFIRDILVDGNDVAIVDAVLSMANALGVNVIAEGVETKEQREYLMVKGCNCYQGYYFARPTVLRELEGMVLNRRLECV